MRMQRIYEWPEIDRNSARLRAESLAQRLAANERGDLDEPLSPEDEIEHRERWAELNYLAYGREQPAPEIPNFSIKFVTSADVGTTVANGVEVSEVEAMAPPVFAVQDVRYRGRLLVKTGDELIGKLEKAKSELAHFERRANRSDFASYAWTGAIIDANSRIAKIEAAIAQAEQQESN